MTQIGTFKHRNNSFPFTTLCALETKCTHYNIWRAGLHQNQGFLCKSYAKVHNTVFCTHTIYNLYFKQKKYKLPLAPLQICRRSWQRPWRWRRSVRWWWLSALGSCPQKCWSLLSSESKTIRRNSENHTKWLNLTIFQSSPCSDVSLSIITLGSTHTIFRHTFQSVNNTLNVFLSMTEYCITCYGHAGLNNEAHLLTHLLHSFSFL